MSRGLLFFLFFFCLAATLIFPSNLSGRKKVNLNPAYASYLKGLVSERYGEPKRALQEYIKAKKFDQESSSLSLRVAVQHIKLNQLEKAIDSLEKLKKDEPVNLDAYLLLILLYSNRGQEEQANQKYEEMLVVLHKEKPDNLRVAESLAQFKMYQGDLDGALGIYKKVLEVDPEYMQAYFWIGYLYEEKGQRFEAIVQWKKALELKPDHPDTLNSLGYIYAEEGINLDEAEILVKKALNINPDSPAYLDSLGWVYFKKEDFSKAREYVERAANALREAVIFDHLGDVYYKLGEVNKAEQAWQEALAMDPKNEDVQGKIEKIKDEVLQE